MKWSDCDVLSTGPGHTVWSLNAPLSDYRHKYRRRYRGRRGLRCTHICHHIHGVGPARLWASDPNWIWYSPVVMWHGLEPSDLYCALKLGKCILIHLFLFNPCRSIEYKIPQLVCSMAKPQCQLHLKLLGSESYALSSVKSCQSRILAPSVISPSFSSSLSIIITSKGQYLKNNDTQLLYFSFSVCVFPSSLWHVRPRAWLALGGWFGSLFWAPYALAQKAEPVSHCNKVALISSLWFCIWRENANECKAVCKLATSWHSKRTSLQYWCHNNVY